MLLIPWAWLILTFGFLIKLSMSKLALLVAELVRYSRFLFELKILGVGATELALFYTLIWALVSKTLLRDLRPMSGIPCRLAAELPASRTSIVMLWFCFRCTALESFIFIKPLELPRLFSYSYFLPIPNGKPPSSGKKLELFELRLWWRLGDEPASL